MVNKGKHFEKKKEKENYKKKQRKDLVIMIAQQNHMYRYQRNNDVWLNGHYIKVNLYINIFCFLLFPSSLSIMKFRTVAPSILK